MTEDKDEKPPLSAGGLSSADVANLNSLGSLNLLHQQLMQLRASVNHFLYPLSQPDTYNSGTSVAETFSEQSQISYDLLKAFSVNYRRHKGTAPFRTVLMEAIFEFVNEKYEANPKGLLSFRAPTADEQAVTTTLPPPGRVEPVVRQSANSPPAIEYVEDGLNDISQINKDWETFTADHNQLTFEKKSETEFMVTLSKPLQQLAILITLVPLRSKLSVYTISVSSPKSPTSDLHASILKELAEHKKPKSFLTFLNLLSSYQTILSDTCLSCNKLIGAATSDLPVLRRWTGTHWGAWHKLC